MNKKELIAALRERVEIEPAKARAVVDALFDAENGVIAQELLKEGGKVTIPGFGTFMTKVRAARQGTNPSNPKEKIQIPARRFVAFKVGKTLKELVRAD